MKTSILKLFIVVAIGFFVVACKTQHVYYTLPDEMLPAVKVDYTKICDKGRKLYEINCAGCHTTKKRGKEIIPDFTDKQLEAYQVRASNSSHETRVSEEQVSAEELSYIVTYLTYKTKSGIVIVSKGHVD